ncbi:MAG: MotA/TolQ/ExbB proton channel family protein [Burkholderiales bacterium]
MLSIIEAAGWPIWTLIIASIVSLAIIVERFRFLRAEVVAPKELLLKTVNQYKQTGVTSEMLGVLRDNSLLGKLFATALYNVKSSRDAMKESIEETGRVVMVDLEKFLTTLGTIASISPLLGLFGTVIGMIEIFGSTNVVGSNPAQLAHGISVALYNTAFGLIVAVPSMIFYRFFRTKVDNLIVSMEQESIKLVEVLHGDRRA